MWYMMMFVVMLCVTIHLEVGRGVRGVSSACDLRKKVWDDVEEHLDRLS